ELRNKGEDQAVIDVLLKPGYDLLRTESFWGGLNKGLGVFMAEGYFKYVRLPIPPDEKKLINSSFYMAPLIPVMMSRDYFYVLVLSKKRAKLYRADAFGMEYVEVPGMPRGVNDVVHFEQKDDQDLFRTSTYGAGSGASFHGIGTGRPDHKTDLAMYFDEVDETLKKEVLREENVPLLLVGVEYLIPIYKQVAKYKPIWSEALTGNHEYEDISSLYPEVRKIMEPYFRERTEKALSNYGNQSATELTSSVPDDVIAAAHYGRVSQLFAQRDAHIWSKFDEMNNKLSVHQTQEEGDECLRDKAISKTLMTGGDVFVLDAAEMPGGS